MSSQCSCERVKQGEGVELDGVRERWEVGRGKKVQSDREDCVPGIQWRSEVVRMGAVVLVGVGVEVEGSI